jgi:hypothetical protein
MAVIRVIVIFLLGAGFAAGAYITGVAQQVPQFFDHWRHLNDAPFLGARSAPVALNITSASPGDSSACPPEYRVRNRTGQPVYFSLDRQDGVLPSRGGIVVPPGGVLGPADDVRAIDRVPVTDDRENCASLVEIDVNDR